MADLPKPSSEGESIFSNGLVLIILILMLLTGYVSGKGILYFKDSNPENLVLLEEVDSENSFSFSKFFGKSEIELGQRVVAVEDLQVRTLPGGSILGLQSKLRMGKVMEGPVEQFDTQWFRINFEKAPSGWVEFDSISNKTKLINFLNFPIIFYHGFKPIGWFLSVFVLLVVLFYRFKLFGEIKLLDSKRKVRDEMAEKNKKEKIEASRTDLGLPTEDHFKNQRWEHVKELMKSKNQSDWRQAIIEADIILDEMLRRMSYDGLTIGDMLKQIEPSDFVNLDKAWEAHKFRNEIAHTGSEFVISKDEAERVISLFQAVFDEFYFV
jgi:hypothetical protein